MSPDEILNCAAKATLTFLEAESDLLKRDVNERSLTHKLAEHLQPLFEGWNVDCEYNRLMDAVKRLPRPVETTTDDTEGRTIFPDIIVHHRGDRKNLLVIEVKKSTNKTPGDDKKLEGLTLRVGDYGYALGIHLILDCKTGTVASATCYRDGGTDEYLSERLAAGLKG